MKNCMEWVIAEQAIFCVSGATVPFYDTLGPESVEFILKQTGTKTVVCTRAELERLCKVKASGQCPHFEYAVLVDGVVPEAAIMAKEAGLKIMSFAKVEAVGAQIIATTGHKHRPPIGKDIFTFCYTSGTTGDPKGALLTHENLISAILGPYEVCPMEINDRHLSYLPLAHIFERIVMAQMYMTGGSIAFFRGDPLLLIEDIQACRPTILPAAPRVLNKIHDKVSICCVYIYRELESFNPNMPRFAHVIKYFPLPPYRFKRVSRQLEAPKRSSLTRRLPRRPTISWPRVN